MIQVKILGFRSPKLDPGYKARRCTGLWFDHLRIFNMRQNLDTQVVFFLLF